MQVVTVKLCCTCGAAAQSASPAWSALTTQVPPPVNETTSTAIVQTLLALASMLNVTGRPELAVAATV